jgi:hypothetical protein
VEPVTVLAMAAMVQALQAMAAEIVVTAQAVQESEDLVMALVTAAVVQEQAQAAIVPEPEPAALSVEQAQAGMLLAQVPALVREQVPASAVQAVTA